MNRVLEGVELGNKMVISRGSLLEMTSLTRITTPNCRFIVSEDLELELEATRGHRSIRKT